MLISTFQVDVTPPIGSALESGYVKSAVKIVDPLSARGIIVFTDDKPVVLCAVDWVCIRNESHDWWRDAIAEAANTSRDRVTVHTTHPHDTPSTDQSVVRFMKREGVVLEGEEGPNIKFEKDAHSLEFEKVAVERVVQAIRQSLNSKQAVSHISMGKAKVEKFASNRRILGKDGKVKHIRYSCCKDAHVRAMDEGLIDPFVRSIGFWNKEQPLASLTWYASHPQSFYCRGAVSYDTIGLARGLREATLPDAAHIHFCGAGGNIAAGKYNDGAPRNRFKLAERLALGMEKAWDNSAKIPVCSENVDWKTTSVALPLAPYIANNMDLLKSRMNDESLPITERVYAAKQLAYAELILAGRTFDISCLKFGPVNLLHLPGELFVEYQLAAQNMFPDKMLCLAAYGDCGPAYIGTKESYEQGGYECEPRVTRVAPEVEDILLNAMRELLK